MLGHPQLWGGPTLHLVKWDEVLTIMLSLLIVWGFLVLDCFVLNYISNTEKGSGEFLCFYDHKFDDTYINVSVLVYLQKLADLKSEEAELVPQSHSLGL